jgi:hypothetical protein
MIQRRDGLDVAGRGLSDGGPIGVYFRDCALYAGDELRTYAIESDGCNYPIPKGSTARPPCTARSTGRMTCCDAFQCWENTATLIRAPLIAWMIGWRHSCAIQQRIP